MKKFAALAILSIVALAGAHAVIIYGTGDPAANTTAPTGSLADSGWQYEGQFGAFVGTVIAPRFFVSAKHVGNQGQFIFNGTNYTIVKQYNDPASDLSIYEIDASQSFPIFAPLFTTQTEVGKLAVAIGTGTQRGGEIFVDNVLRGWFCGPGDGVRRWGQNVISDTVFIRDVGSTAVQEALYAEFNQNGSPDECHLSGGDSGGAIFIEEEGVWKLAGINYAVDGPYYTDSSGNGEFVAALFDARGFYVPSGSSYTQITSTNPVPSGFYATRISAKLAWIYSVIDPLSDYDGDGVTNLGEYGHGLDPLTADAAGAFDVGREGTFLTLTYRRVFRATDISYVVETSEDLLTWAPADVEEESIDDDDIVEVVKAKIEIGTATALFARLRLARP